ncbi:MAG: zf-HC2 domain-containing protein [Emergencia sp.]|nr:zf-HC2 domain-containing protein [Emergencia sp.]
MRNEIVCELIRDLLPSYLEGLTSPASTEAIENHLQTCASCAQYAEDMEAEIETPQLPSEKENAAADADHDIKPFLKLRKRTRRAVGITVLTLLLIFGGGTYYFSHGFSPDINDIAITCENFDGMVDITFTSKSQNVVLNSYVGGYHESAGEEEVDYVQLEAYHKNPFKKAIRNKAYFGYTFIDKDTIYDSFGNKTHITDQSYFALSLKDKVVKINIADLYQGKITFME